MRSSSRSYTDFKESVKFTTTGNISLSGLSTQAGGDWPSALTDGDRVLVKDQTLSQNNGIYTASSSDWVRAFDADQVYEVTSGMVVAVTSGDTKAGTIWVLSTDDPIVIGTSPLVFIQPVSAPVGSTPVGLVNAFAGSTAPDGWLMCYGQPVDRDDYSLLFGIIGTTYGIGDGVNTFNVPDLRGRAVSGLDNMGGSDAGRLDWANTLGTSGGAQSITLAENQMPAHSHTVNSHSHGGTTGGANATITSATAASSGAHVHYPNVDSFFRTAPDGSAYQLKSTQIITGTGSGYYAESTTYTNGQTSSEGAHTHTVTVNQSNHSHTISAESPGTDSKGGGLSHDNMQPTILLNYIIFAGA